MRTRVLLIAVILLCAGCDAELQSARRFAESLRSSTERTARKSAAASEAREVKILADAEQIDRQRAATEGEQPLSERYETSREAGGWTVYDTTTGQPVRVRSKRQSGLSRHAAENLLADLQESGN